MADLTEHHNRQMDRILFGEQEDPEQRIEKMLTFDCGDMGKRTLGEVVLMSETFKKDMQTRTANMLDLVFDARENLKDSEYKNLSEECGEIHPYGGAHVFLTAIVAERLKILCAKFEIQQLMMRDMEDQMKTYREKLFRARRELEEKDRKVIHNLKDEKPSIICSCGKTYKSKAGLKRHRKKTKCPTITPYKRLSPGSVCICVCDCIC